MDESTLVLKMDGLECSALHFDCDFDEADGPEKSEVVDNQKKKGVNCPCKFLDDFTPEYLRSLVAPHCLLVDRFINQSLYYS